MMSIYKIQQTDIQNKKLDIFTDVIYTSFVHLKKYTQLKHSRYEIKRLLKSQNTHIYLILVEGGIASYLISQVLELDDGRIVMFINYIFTSDKFRNQGFASTLLDEAEQYAKKNKYNYMMLTCDTNKKSVYDFYLKKGYMPDLILRTYDRFEILSKNI